MKKLIILFIPILFLCSCSSDDDDSNKYETIASFTVKSAYYAGMWSISEDKEFQSDPFTVMEVIGYSGKNEFSIPGFGYSYKITPNPSKGDNWYTISIKYPERSESTRILIKGKFD